MSKEHGLIEPFEAGQVKQGVISYGVSSYGYDLRLSREFQAPRFQEDTIVDPKDGSSLEYDSLIADSILVPPGSFVLARSLEYFRIPRDVLALCTGKSTYARSGVVVNITPLEPEWEGYITINIFNAGPVPVKLYASEGAAQVIFIAADQVCETSYADRKGKYQAQQGITQSKI
jgi:dCTP deaminase